MSRYLKLSGETLSDSLDMIGIPGLYVQISVVQHILYPENEDVSHSVQMPNRRLSACGSSICDGESIT